MRPKHNVSAGYSEKGAAVSASRLRRNAKVAARMQELQTKQAEDIIAQILNLSWDRGQ